MIPTYGDYFGLTSAPDRTFRAFWPEINDGHSVLMMATIDVVSRVARRP